MAENIKKFLDQAGVSTLWGEVAKSVAAVDAKVGKNANDIKGLDTRLETAEGKIQSLEENAYDDTEVRGLINTNKEGIKKNADAITLLNSSAETVGSVANTATNIAATKVAEIVAGADASFDTLKEIADWILSDTTGAAGMANDISALQAKMTGIDTTVVAKIASEIEAALKVDGADKYALASSLTALADRVTALENAGYQNAAQVGSAIDRKIEALDLANTYDAKGAAAAAEANAKAYADGLAKNYDAAGSADQALVDAKAYSDANLAEAKSYTDTAMSKIQALTEAEILAAINPVQA